MSNSTSESDAVRLDVWLWCVRIFKTRSLAAQACRKGRVTIRDHAAKASRLVRIGDEVLVKRRFLTLHLRVVGLLTRRIGAKVVPDFCEDLTSEEEVEAARERTRAIAKAPQRDDGRGRPTKKDRREMEEMELEAAEDRRKREELFEKWMREAEL